LGQRQENSGLQTMIIFATDLLSLLTRADEMNFLMLGLHTSDGLYSIVVLVKRYSKAKGRESVAGRAF
jgi:hypothetical protein